MVEWFFVWYFEILTLFIDLFNTIKWPFWVFLILFWFWEILKNPIETLRKTFGWITFFQFGFGFPIFVNKYIKIESVILGTVIWVAGWVIGFYLSKLIMGKKLWNSC